MLVSCISNRWTAQPKSLHHTMQLVPDVEHVCECVCTNPDAKVQPGSANRPGAIHVDTCTSMGDCLDCMGVDRSFRSLQYTLMCGHVSDDSGCTAGIAVTSLNGLASKRMQPQHTP